MHSDGEDRPEDVPKLLARHAASPGSVILAQRSRRSESALFKASLAVYKLLFRVLVGRVIDFGNFSLLPITAVQRLCHTSDLWNNLPAAVMRSRMPYELVPTDRGRRYVGKSKMNWMGLVIHGLSALSVFADVILVRLLATAAAISGIALIGIAVAIVIRIATDLAVPGWTTTVVGIFLIVLVQMAVAIIVASLALLGGRTHRNFVPKTDCAPLVAGRETAELYTAPT